MSTEDFSRLERFMQTVAKMDLTWTCMGCALVFENRPDDEQPVGVKVGIRNGVQYEVGNLCKRCMP